jgi:hypothetical protein
MNNVLFAIRGKADPSSDTIGVGKTPDMDLKAVKVIFM